MPPFTKITNAAMHYDIFECTECCAKARVKLSSGPGLRFPLHCGHVMRMFDGHELNKLLRKKTAAVLDVEEAADGSLVVEEPAVEEAAPE